MPAMYIQACSVLLNCAVHPSLQYVLGISQADESMGTEKDWNLMWLSWHRQHRNLRCRQRASLVRSYAVCSLLRYRGSFTSVPDRSRYRVAGAVRQVLQRTHVDLPWQSCYNRDSHSTLQIMQASIPSVMCHCQECDWPVLRPVKVLPAGCATLSHHDGRLAYHVDHPPTVVKHASAMI